MDDLRVALRDAAASPSRDRSLADIATLARRRRKRRHALAVTAAAVLVATSASVALLLNGGAEHSSNVLVQPDETTAPAPTSSATTPPSATAPSMPTRAVGLSTAGELVAIETASGATTRLADDSSLDHVASGVGRVTLAPDGVVYYERFGPRENGGPGEADVHQVWRVDTAGHTSLVIDDASSPSVSLDGKSLAFIRSGRITVRSLASGSDHVLGQAPSETTATDIGGWSPDGTRIVYTYSNGTQDRYVAVANVGDGSAEDLAALGSVTDPRWLSDSRLVYLSGCCLGTSTKVMTHDLRAETDSVLVDLTATLGYDFMSSRLAVDASGQWLLILAASAPGGQPAGPQSVHSVYVGPGGPRVTTLPFPELQFAAW